MGVGNYQGKVGIADRVADELDVAQRIVGEKSLEPPAQELGNASLSEALGSPQRGDLPLLVVEVSAERMMRLMGLRDEIGDGELDLMRPETQALVRRRRPRRSPR